MQQQLATTVSGGQAAAALQPMQQQPQALTTAGLSGPALVSQVSAAPMAALPVAAGGGTVGAEQPNPFRLKVQVRRSMSQKGITIGWRRPWISCSSLHLYCLVPTCNSPPAQRGHSAMVMRQVIGGHAMRACTWGPHAAWT